MTLQINYDKLYLYIAVSCRLFINAVKRVLRDHIKQDIFLAFQTGGCLLLHERSAESSLELSLLLSYSNKQPPIFNYFQVT